MPLYKKKKAIELNVFYNLLITVERTDGLLLFTRALMRSEMQTTSGH